MTPNNRNIVGHYPLGMSELDLLLYDPNVYALWRTDGYDKEMFQSDDSGKYGVLSNNVIFSQATYYPQLAAVAQVHMNRRYGKDTWNDFNHTNAKPFGEAGYFGETTSNYNNNNNMNENSFDATTSARDRQMARTLFSQLMFGMPYPPEALAKNKEMLRGRGESNMTGISTAPLASATSTTTYPSKSTTLATQTVSLAPKTLTSTSLATAPRETTTTIPRETTTTTTSMPRTVSTTNLATSPTTTLQQMPTSVSPTSSPTTSLTTSPTTYVPPRTTTLVSSGTTGSLVVQPVTTTGSIPRPAGPGTSIVTTTPGGTTIVEPVAPGTAVSVAPIGMGGAAPMGGGGGGGMGGAPEELAAKEEGAEGAEGAGAGAGGGGMEELQKNCKLNYMPILFGGLILGGVGYLYAKNKKKDVKMPLIIMALAGAVLGYLYSQHQCKPNATLSKLGVKSKIVEDMNKIEAQRQAAAQAAPKQEKKFCGCGA